MYYVYTYLRCFFFVCADSRRSNHYSPIPHLFLNAAVSVSNQYSTLCLLKYDVLCVLRVHMFPFVLIFLVGSKYSNHYISAPPSYVDLFPNISCSVCNQYFTPCFLVIDFLISLNNRYYYPTMYCVERKCLRCNFWNLAGKCICGGMG